MCVLYCVLSNSVCVYGYMIVCLHTCVCVCVCVCVRECVVFVYICVCSQVKTDSWVHNGGSIRAVSVCQPRLCGQTNAATIVHCMCVCVWVCVYVC